MSSIETQSMEMTEDDTASPEVVGVPETGENIENSTTAETSEEAINIKNELLKKAARKENNKFVLDWLLKNPESPEEKEFYLKFKDVLEKEGDDTAGLDESAELLRMLPELFQQVDSKIAELAKNTAEYSNIQEKRAQIIKGICEPILNGHLTVEDAFALVSGIEIVSKNDPEKQQIFQQLGLRNGYEGVMFFDATAHKMYIFSETLVDDFKENGKSMKLFIDHMVTHEVSHSVVERAMRQNKTLSEQADKIIAQAEKLDDNFADSQSQHIRNTLNSVKNAKADFEEYFATNKEFQALSEEQKQQIKPAKEQEFIADRKTRAKVEILADYTALYLQSDGSIEDFVMTCLKKTNQKALENYLGKSFDKVKLANLNKVTKRETKLEKMKELGENFPALINTYLAFYNEIKRTMASSKGKFAETNEEDEDLDLLGEYYGGGFMDGPAGFTDKGQSGGRGGGDSLWSEIGALVKAMAEEVPNVR